MATGAPAAKSIAEAINEVTDDDVLEDDATEEGEGEGEGEGSGGTLLDEADSDDAEGEDDADGEEGARTGDVEGEPDADDDSAPKTGEPDVFDDLTPEEFAAIKADPALNKLRKSLMRGYSTKTQEHAQLVQLGLAYRKDPHGVAKAIAESLGMAVSPKQAAAAAQPAAKDPGVELEELFGPQIGPKVRAVFDKWAEARIGTAVGPVQQTLGKVVGASEQARMLSEEQSFKSRHKITPDIEAEVVALGNSGKIVPGDMTPAEYLDTLYDVVMARRARTAARTAGKTASTKLAARIEANRRDREPAGRSGRGGTIKPVSKVSEAKSISEALDLAMAELENER